MNKYSVKNIKSFKDIAEVEIKPITIFVGKNSCGKSSLIRFPVVIAQSALSDADTPILFFGKSLDYGNYEDVVFGHSKKGKMEFSVSYECVPDRYLFRLGKGSRFVKYFTKPWSIDINVGLAKYSKRVIVDSCKVDIEGKEAIVISRIQNEKYYIKFIDVTENDFGIGFEAKHLRFTKFIPFFSVQTFFEQIVDSYCEKNGLNEEDTQKIKKLKKSLASRSYEFMEDKAEEDCENSDIAHIRKACQLVDFYSLIMMNARMQSMQDASDTYYIGPFRENPSRVYRDVEHQVDSVGARGEDVSAMLKNDYSHGKKIITKVSEWFENAMNYKLSLNDMGSGLYNIVVRKADGTEDNLIDVGYGISQVLPIVAQLVKINSSPRKNYYGTSLNDKNNSTFIIEQPELHLHPGAQAELANLFVDIVSQNTDDKAVNVLIETHSEHLIRRLQALIANKNVNISSNQVKIYYVDKNDKNEAYITEMHILDNGQFEDEWPTGFFDKAYELSMELLRNNF